MKLHRLTGWSARGLASLISVLGISTAIIMDRFRTVRLHEVGVNPFFSIQALDILSFTAFFWLAIYWRKKPEYHRRLVLIATIALTSAGFGRIPMISFHWFYAAVNALIVLGVARDLIVNRRIHIVYRYAVPALIVCQIFAVQMWLHHPAWWVRIANAIIMG